MKRAARILVSILAVVLVLWLTSLGLVLLAGSHPELRRADAIVVLGAAQYNGHPSPVLKARLDHAVHLYRQGLAPYLIATGGVGVGDTLSEGEVARRYVMKQGVPDSAILLDRRGRTSRESIENAAALMRAHGLHSALLVSDSWHMLRLQVLARRSGIEGYRAPMPSSPIDRSVTERRHYVLRESLLAPAAALLSLFRHAN